MRNENKCKVKKLDIRFAASVVGDGSNGITGPYENALSQFHFKTIIPLCFGAFGEVNEDLDKVIQCLAREAASTDEGLTNLTFVNTQGSRKKDMFCAGILRKSFARRSKYPRTTQDASPEG
jgi:hypothetical protein